MGFAMLLFASPSASPSRASLPMHHPSSSISPAARRKLPAASTPSKPSPIPPASMSSDVCCATMFRHRRSHASHPTHRSRGHRRQRAASGCRGRRQCRNFAAHRRRAAARPRPGATRSHSRASSGTMNNLTIGGMDDRNLKSPLSQSIANSAGGTLLSVPLPITRPSPAAPAPAPRTMASPACTLT